MGEEVYFDCQAKRYTFPSDCSVCLSSYTPVRLSACVFSTGFFLNKNTEYHRSKAYCNFKLQLAY